MIQIDPPKNNPIMQVVRDFLPFLDIEDGPWLAGGSVRKIVCDMQDIGHSDFDIYFPNKTMYEWSISYLKEKHNGKLAKPDTILHGTEIYITPENAEKEFVPYKFQLLNKFNFYNLHSLLDDFDLTIAMFATDGNVIMAGENSLENLKEKKLVMHKPSKYPRASRLAKYCFQGFTPAPGVVKTMFGLDSKAMINIEKLTFEDGY